jgi:asparagine synthase (glutamine-hydrolysing)
VAARLRSDRPVFAELSGGLDSSTIVLMADRVLREQNRSAADLQTTSCVYERSETCDEKRFIQAVEEKRGISTNLVHERDQKATLGLNDPEFTGLPNPLHCFPGRYPAVAEQMRSYGAVVLLTGCGGDHLFWSEPDGVPLVADEISQAHFLKAHSAVGAWSVAASAPYYELLFNKALPLAFEARYTGKFNYKVPALPAWLHPRFCREIPFITPSFQKCATWSSAPSKRAQMVLIEHMFRYLGSGFVQEYCDLYVSNPYSHRPLIEFCLGTPVSQFLRNGETRSLMRRAFRDLLPEKTVKRVSKGLLDEAITRALQADSATFLDMSTWQICEREYVVRDRIIEALNRARLGELSLIGNVIRICSLERWLRSLGTARCGKAPVLDQSSLVAG